MLPLHASSPSSLGELYLILGRYGGGKGWLFWSVSRRSTADGIKLVPKGLLSFRLFGWVVNFTKTNVGVFFSPWFLVSPFPEASHIGSTGHKYSHQFFVWTTLILISFYVSNNRRVGRKVVFLFSPNNGIICIFIFT